MNFNLLFKGKLGRCYLHYGHRNGEANTEDEVNRVLEALNDLSLTLTPISDKNKNDDPATNGEGGEEGEGGAAGDDGKQQAEETAEVDSAASKLPKVINLKVELVKRVDKIKHAPETAGAGGTVNGDGDPASGGEGSGARIESVDTTTV